MKLAALALTALWSAAASSQPARSLHDVEKLDQLEKKAFGHVGMCTCVTDNLAVMWSFDDYIAITTRSKEHNGYATMTKDRKASYDKVAAVRDQCVKQHIR